MGGHRSDLLWLHEHRYIHKGRRARRRRQQVCRFTEAPLVHWSVQQHTGLLQGPPSCVACRTSLCVWLAAPLSVCGLRHLSPCVACRTSLRVWLAAPPSVCGLPHLPLCVACHTSSTKDHTCRLDMYMHMSMSMYMSHAVRCRRCSRTGRCRRATSSAHALNACSGDTPAACSGRRWVQCTVSLCRG
jgi:hypothetical protein